MRYATTMSIVSISGFLPLLPMMALFHSIVLRKNRKGNLKTARAHIIATYLFCLAVVCILSVTSIPGVYHFSVDMKVSLTPFDDILTNSLEYVLNIMLFIPLGILMPMLWREFEKKHTTFLCGFLFSLSIELIQLFNNRITDIDDLLMNTTGTIIGYFLFMGIKRVFPRISMVAIDCANYWKWEPYICFGSAWISMLFFKPILSSWLLGGVVLK